MLADWLCCCCPSHVVYFLSALPSAFLRLTYFLNSLSTQHLFPLIPAASLPYSVEQGVTLRLDEFQIIKGAPKIVEKPDSEYPEWLWTVHQPLITLDELRKIGFDGMTDMQKKRYFRLLRRQLIKTNNASRSK